MLGCDMAGMSGMMWFGWLGGLGILVGLIAFGVWAVRRFGQPGTGAAAGQILQERFARGEISAEEFADRRRILEDAR